jgi:branched-chain amino acid transport system substrate-binding protein
MRPHRYITAAALAAAIVVASGCDEEPLFPEGSPLVVGAAVSMTGGYQATSLSMVRGYQLAVAMLNERGGIAGRPVQLILYDDESSPAKSVALYTKLLGEHEVDLVLSPYGSEITAATLPLLEAAGMPVVAAAASDETIWEGKSRQWTVEMIGPGREYLDGAVEVAAAAGVKNVALVYENNPFAISVAAGIRQTAQQLGLTLKLDQAFPFGQLDFTALATTAKNTGADLFIGGGFPAQNAALTKAAAEVGYKPKLMSWDLGVPTDDFVRQVGALARCVSGNAYWLPDMTTSGIITDNATFVKRYETYWRIPADYLAATGFAAVELWSAAVEDSFDATDTIDRQRIRDFLFNARVQTVIGPYAVVPTGVDAGKQTAVENLILQWQPGPSGALVSRVIHPTKAAAASPCFL